MSVRVVCLNIRVNGASTRVGERAGEFKVSSVYIEQGRSYCVYLSPFRPISKCDTSLLILQRREIGAKEYIWVHLCPFILRLSRSSLPKSPLI